MTLARPASASAVVMAAASTQTQDDSVDVGPTAAQNAAKLNESCNQTLPLTDGVRSPEPLPVKPVSDMSVAHGLAGSELAQSSSGVANWSCSAVPRSSAVITQGTTSSTAPSFIDRQTARVRPRILTHVIEGFVIQEATEPFPVCCLVMNACWILAMDYRYVLCMLYEFLM